MLKYALHASSDKRPKAAPQAFAISAENDYSHDMRLRTRKFLGTLATFMWLITYSLVMMAIGGALVVGRGALFELPFYAVAGLLWIPIEMLIIRWMSKPDAEASIDV